MPTTPQQKAIVNDKLRPLADRFGQLYNFCKSLQAEAAAENWTAMFVSSTEVIEDGAASDGRTPITFADVVAEMNVVTTFLTYMEQSSNANRNLMLRIAVNPERI